jgi:CO/xanthine dehydrogenase Mo-binding subunit
VHEVIERCAAVPFPPEERSGRRDPISLPGGVAGNVGRGESIRRGVGFAVGYKNIAYSEGFDDSSEARVTVSRGNDGELLAEIHCAAAEVGQGVHTVLAQIARQELEIDGVVIHPADTSVGSSGSSSASRQTMMSGGAVLLACRAVKEELDARGGLLDEPISATRTYHHRKTQPLDEKGQGDVHVSLAFAAERAVVEVDTELGLVRVVQIAAAQDVGRAINPQSVHGQIEGGTAQGLGLALMEEIQLKDGVVQNASFTDYLIPTILDMPPMVSELVEEPEPGVPYGAKGVGEPSTIVAPAAIAAALRDATGRELNRIPVKPDDLVGLAAPAQSGGWPPSPPVPGPKPLPEYVGLGAGQQELGGQGGKG